MADRHEECEICRGSKSVNLPIYRRLSAVMFDASMRVDDIISEPTSKRFPCPECSDTIATEQIHAITEVHEVTELQDATGRYDESVRFNLANHIAKFMLENDFIQFDKGLSNGRVYPLRARVGLVKKDKVGNFFAEVEKQQATVAQKVADASCDAIDNWGSAFGNTDIEKSTAKRLIREMFKRFRKV